MQIFEGQVRFGLHAGQQYTDYPSYVDLWQSVEALGYDWASVFWAAGSPARFAGHDDFRRRG